MRAAGRILLALVMAWALLVVGAPWLALGRDTSDGVWRVSALAYAIGGMVCHQQPDRSFHMAGAQLPVCARCTGLYVSAAVGVLGAWGAWRLWPRWRTRLEPGGAGWRQALLLAALPTILTVLLEWAGLWAPGNALRAVAGVPLGAVTGALLAASMSFQGRL
jgi:uncharacterized membrane protein